MAIVFPRVYNDYNMQFGFKIFLFVFNILLQNVTAIHVSCSIRITQLCISKLPSL